MKNFPERCSRTSNCVTMLRTAQAMLTSPCNTSCTMNISGLEFVLCGFKRDPRYSGLAFSRSLVVHSTLMRACDGHVPGIIVDNFGPGALAGTARTSCNQQMFFHNFHWRWSCTMSCAWICREPSAAPGGCCVTGTEHRVASDVKKLYSPWGSFLQAVNSA